MSLPKEQQHLVIDVYVLLFHNLYAISEFCAHRKFIMNEWAPVEFSMIKRQGSSALSILSILFTSPCILRETE